MRRRLSVKHYSRQFAAPPLVSLRRYKLISSLRLISGEDADSSSSTINSPFTSRDCRDMDTESYFDPIESVICSDVRYDSDELSIMSRLDRLIEKALVLAPEVLPNNSSDESILTDASCTSSSVLVADRIDLIERVFDTLAGKLDSLEKDHHSNKEVIRSHASDKESEMSALVTQLIEYKMGWASQQSEIDTLRRELRGSNVELLRLRGKVEDLRRVKTPTLGSMLTNKLGAVSDTRRDTFS
jgi:hypothetical protein